MARLIIEWIPDEKEFFNYRKMERQIDDSATIYEMFEVWKEMMGFLGYSVESYDLNFEEKDN